VTSCGEASVTAAFPDELQAIGPGKVHLAIGLRWSRFDLRGADGLYVGGNRLAESAAYVEAEERRLNEEKYGITRILGRHKSRDL
jgi:hypothetical protein